MMKKDVDLFSSRNAQIIVAILLVTLIFFARLLPHAANFTPVAAVGLFAGVYLRKSWALMIPIAGLFLSNLFLPANSFAGNLIVVAAVLCGSLIGRLISRKNSFAKSSGLGKIAKVGGGAIVASVLFFLITNCNFLYNGYGFYPMNFAGMIESYVAGIPFFRNQILGDLIYSGALFGAYEFAKIMVKNFAKSRKTAKSNY